MISYTHYNNIIIMQGLKPILDVDFKYRLIPLKTKIDIKTDKEIEKNLQW